MTEWNYIIEGYKKCNVSKVLVIREQGRTLRNCLELHKLRFTKITGKNCVTDIEMEEWNRLCSHMIRVNTYDKYFKNCQIWSWIGRMRNNEKF